MAVTPSIQIFFNTKILISWMQTIAAPFTLWVSFQVISVVCPQVVASMCRPSPLSSQNRPVKAQGYELRGGFKKRSKVK